MEDYWIRSVTEDGTVRAMAAVTTATVEQARRRHGTAPTATAALGRAQAEAGQLRAAQRYGQPNADRINGDRPLGEGLETNDAVSTQRVYVSKPEVRRPLT